MRRLNDERGATAVFVGILILVLFGLAAMVIDVGNGFWERRMLQNAADAGALAAAQDFAADLDSATAETTARDFADPNNQRGAFVETFDPDFDEQSITVGTRTGDREASGFLSTWFAGVLGFEGDYFARARATAIWGAANVADAELPLTVSMCDWDDAAPGGVQDLGTVDELPTGDYQGTTRGDVIIFHNSQDPHDECSAQPGFDADEDGKLPAGFGWLHEDEYTECGIEQIPADEDDYFWAYKDPGNNPIRHCLEDALGRAVVIPIFVDFERDNPRDRYLLWAPAAFYLTGWRFPGETQPQNDPPCQAPKTCISGHFVLKSEADADPTGDINLGVTAVGLIE